MQVRNFQDISNGDIGYVAAVENREDGPVLKVDFGEDRVMEYDGSQLDLLDLAYATTIHKSQGSEYDSVIISVQCAHSVMLNRPLALHRRHPGEKNG